jgi:hypothetical protein
MQLSFVRVTAAMLLGCSFTAAASAAEAPRAEVAPASGWEEPPPPHHFTYENTRSVPPRQAADARGAAGGSRADEHADPFRAGTGSFSGVYGLFTPIGELGIEAQYSLSRSFVLSAGAGLGTWGAQVAAMPRYRIITGEWAFGFGAGASYGRYGWFENWLPDTCKQECAHKTGNIGWGNGEFFSEYRHKHLVTRLFAGLGVALNPDGLACDHTIGESSYNHCLHGHADDGKPLALPYAGGTVGFSFDLLGTR